MGGSINFLGAQALLAGTVKQNVGSTINSLDLRGSVGRNVQVIAIGDRDPLNAPLIPRIICGNFAKLF